MKNKKWITLGLAILALINSASSYADREVGNGGDSRCAEFYAIASQISIALTKTGQTAIDRTNPAIQASKVREQLARLKVLPAHRLDRQAITDPSTAVTHLDVRKWKRIDDYAERVRLVSHELMVLTSVEFEGDYQISKDLFQLLTHSRYFLSLRVARSVENYDGSVSIVTPYYEGNAIAITSSADGICKYLGFDEAIPGTLTTAQGDLIFHNGDECYTAELSANAQLTARRACTLMPTVYLGAQEFSFEFVRTVSCK